MNWSKCLREFREGMGWSVEQAAKEAGVSRASWEAWEKKGGRPPVFARTKEALKNCMSKYNFDFARYDSKKGKGWKR